MLEAKDLMTKQVICIRKDTPILEAIKLMAKNNVTGIPVVEDDTTLVGILSEQDVLPCSSQFYSASRARYQ